MHIVAGHTAHVAAIMLASLPIEVASIGRMAGEARLIDLRRRNFAGIYGSFRGFRACAVLRMFVTIAVAALANGSARIREKLPTLAMRIQRESFDNHLVTLTAVAADYFLLWRLTRGSSRGGLSFSWQF